MILQGARQSAVMSSRILSRPERLEQEKVNEDGGGAVQQSPTAFHLRLPEMETGAALMEESKPSINITKTSPQNNASEMHALGES